MSPSARTLWLPLRHPSLAWTATGVVAAFYSATMARDLSAYDSAELALVAHELGLGHPIGQPLHTMLGFVAAHLPGVPALVGLCLLSAVPAALALVPACSIAERLAPQAFAGRAPAAFGTAAIAAHALQLALWEPATRVEVYALATVLALWGVARALGHLDGAEGGGRRWAWVGLAFGLAASANAYVAVIGAAALAPALVVAVVRKRLSVGVLGAVFGGGIAGLLPYVYVPLIAARGPHTFVWGAPGGAAEAWHYFSGADYARSRAVAEIHLGENLVTWAEWATLDGLLPLLLVGLLASCALGGRLPAGRLVAPLAMGLALLLICSNSVFHPDVPDYLGYLAGPTLVCAAGTGALAARIATGGRDMRILAAALCLLLVVAGAVAPVPLLSRTRHRDSALRVLAEGALRGAPRDAILVVGSDHWAAPLLYLQEAEGVRPDVVVFAHGLGSSSWFWEHVHARHPDLEPFSLHGPGGRFGRLRRFLDANRARPVLVENVGLAASLELPSCDVGWLVRVGACARSGSADAATRAMTAALSEIGTGAPPTDGALAAVALDRGEALWRLGRGREAYHALLAGVPDGSRPVDESVERALSTAPPLVGPLPAWSELAALGDPRRDLFLTGMLLRAAGHPDLASAYIGRASEEGLPEARSALP